MADTRPVKSPGVFANDAVTAIPPLPIAGVAYRNTATSEAEVEGGWPFAIRVDSAEFNQVMFLVTSLLQILDRQGMLGWTAAVEYAANAYALGSDGAMYRALLASGPTTAPQDPVTAPTYWARFGGLAASAAEVTAGTVADKFVSPATLLQGLLGLGSLGAAGYARLPFRDGGGARRELIVQWGSVFFGNLTIGGASSAVVFPITFPTAVMQVFATARDDNGTRAAYAASRAPSLSGVTVDINEVFGSATESASVNYLAIGY